MTPFVTMNQTYFLVLHCICIIYVYDHKSVSKANGIPLGIPGLEKQH